jgi:RHS repeat-associated protein
LLDLTAYADAGSNACLAKRESSSPAGWNLYGKGIDEVLMRGDYVVIPGGQGYFYQQNHLGSVTHLTGWAGETIEKYSYDAYGAPTTTYSGGSFNNRFKFTGREYASSSGIYEYRNRAYHPGLGRFVSEDPKGFAAGDYNLFRYCGNDPVNKTDPMGLEYDEPFTSPDAVARDFNKIYNKLSIRENMEYGSRIYKTAAGKYSYAKPAAGTEGDSKTRKDIPHGAKVAGDIHSHGDYSTGYTDREGRKHITGRVNRSQSNWRSKDSFESDKPSRSDKNFWHNEGKGQKEHNGYVTTPGNTIWKQNGVDQNSRPYMIDPAQGSSNQSSARDIKPKQPQSAGPTGLEYSYDSSFNAFAK